jgi:soluble lytic murein transglycosylase-like protein
MRNMTLGRTLTAVLLLMAAALACAADPAPDPELRDVLRKAASESPSFADRFHAEVWLTDMSARLARQVKDPEERIKLLTLVHMEAKRVELPPELILAVIEVESNFDRYAVSVAGALGLMQIMPFWLNEIGRPDDNLLHTDTNLRYGCTILRFYYDKENGDLRRALGRYNGSLGRRKYPNKVIDKLTRKWFKA